MAVLGGIGVVAFHQPIRSVLSLVVVMLALSILYLLLSAQFVFAAQIIVYAGAVMVLFLLLIAVLFGLGAVGVLVRRNPLVILISIELMLNAANLTLVTFARQLQNLEGQLFALMSMTVAAAEAVVGLAILVDIFHTRDVEDVDDLSELKG